MKTLLILHGWGGNSNSIWLPWLKNTTEYISDAVYLPNLPNTDNPTLNEQLDYINVYTGDFNDGGNIVGHSLGCKLALKFVEENNIKNSVLVLVAPVYPLLATDLGREVFGNSYDNLEEYFDENIDFEKINKLNNKIIVFLSNDDPFINQDKAKKYFSNFNNIEIIDFKNKGHFNGSAGVLELEEILDYVK